MTTKEELHHLVDRLAEGEAEDALEYLRWLTEPVDVLTEEELRLLKTGEEEIARGEFATLAELERRLGE